MSALRPALVLIAAFTLLLGLAFPLGMVAVGSVLFPRQAAGSLIVRDGHVIGSALIGQDFTGARYFHPRPSATTPKPYAADASAASNLGPTSKQLIARVRADLTKISGAKAAPAPVPADAVTTSASGLDPDISPANAERQVARVAAARGVAPARVEALLASHIQGRLLGLIGEPRANVLRLNLTLDALPPR